MVGYSAPGELRDLMDKVLPFTASIRSDRIMTPKSLGFCGGATALIASGKLYVPVAATYPLSAIKDAVAHVERGGKVLLDMQKE